MLALEEVDEIRRGQDQLVIDLLHYDASLAESSRATLAV
jgi:hypothetical protein